MSEANPETRSHLEELQAAIEDPRWDFRTLEGLAHDLDLPPEELAEMLAEHPEIARKSILTDHEGHELYAARDRAPTVRERIERFRSVL